MLFRHTATFFFLLLLLYTCVSGGHIYSGDGIVMQRVTEAIWKRGEVSVRPIRGYENYAVRKGTDEKSYGKYGPGLSVLALPLYAAGRAVSRWVPASSVQAFDYPALLYFDRNDKEEVIPVFFTALTNAVIVAALCAVLFNLLMVLGFSLPWAFAVALFFALGSPTPFFAKTFFSEPLAALGYLGSWWGIERYSRSPKHGWLLLSGAATGLALSARLGSAVALPALGIGLFLTLRQSFPKDSLGKAVGRLAIWATPVAVICTLIGAYNFTRFGSILETGYGSEAGAFSAPFWEGLWGLIASPGRGVLLYAPIFLLAIAGVPQLWRRNRGLFVFSWGTFAALWLVHAPWHMWEGGWCYSPRFLFPALPLLAISAAHGAQSLWNSMRLRGFLLAAVAWSLALSFQSITVNYLDFHFYFFMNNGADKEAFRWAWEMAPAAAYWTFPVKHFLVWPRLMVGLGGPLLQALAWVVVGLAPLFALRWFNVLGRSGKTLDS